MSGWAREPGTVESTGDHDSSEPHGHDANGSGPALAPVERRERIAEAVLRQDDIVLAKDLAARFDVSIMTVHRDLDELERQGMLRKVRGGATPSPSSLFESNVRFRMTAAATAKHAIARHALSLIEPGQSVMLDDSTTAHALAGMLPGVVPITVMTNFFPTIDELRGVEGIRLISLGGEYYPRHDSFVGVGCERAIAQLRADVLFMSTSAVSEGYAFHQEQEIVAIKQAMLNAATRKILLVDHTKLGKVAIHRLTPLTTFDRIIVDSEAAPELLRDVREAGVTVEVAD